MGLVSNLHNFDITIELTSYSAGLPPSQTDTTAP